MSAAPSPDSIDVAAARAAASAQLWPSVRKALRLVQEDDLASQEISKFMLTRDPNLDRQQFETLSAALHPAMMNSRDFNMLIPQRLQMVVELTYDELIGISVMGPFWRDNSISEILVDAWDSVTVERSGTLIRTPVTFVDVTHAKDVARRLALKVSDRALNPATPLVTAELPGARVAFAIDSVVKSGISISMRKFPPLLGMEQLLEYEALDEATRELLADAVAARANIVVSGGTGTGKTTFINALSEFIPDGERVITIEDAYELSLKAKHWVAMQTKEAASGDDEVRVDLAALLRSALRMRPDRIIVGEIRESEGAAAMLQAANTGHDGTMTTIHANSPDRALNFRLSGLIRTAQSMPSEVAAAEVASAVDMVVQVVRERGRRFVSEVVVCDPSMLHGSAIRPVKVAGGRLVDGRPTFEPVGRVPADSALALKLAEHGLADKWTAR